MDEILLGQLLIDNGTAITAASRFLFRDIAQNIIEAFIEKIRIYRYTSVVIALGKAERQFEKQGITVSGFDLKHISPILEGVSLETEDSEMLDRWAALLVSAITVENMSYGFADVLRQLNAVDVKILDMIVEYSSSPENLEKEAVDFQNILSDVRMAVIDDETRIEISLENLQRLGIIGVLRIGNSENDELMKFTRITAFGREFLLRCTEASTTSDA